VEPTVATQPAPEGRGLAGADVFEDDVDLAGRVGPAKQPEEGQEVLAGVALAGLVRHRAVRDRYASDPPKLGGFFPLYRQP